MSSEYWSFGFWDTYRAGFGVPWTAEEENTKFQILKVCLLKHKKRTENYEDDVKVDLQYLILCGQNSQNAHYARCKPKSSQSDLSRMFFPLSQKRHTSTISLSDSYRGLYCRIKTEIKSGKHHCFPVWRETNYNSSWHTPNSSFQPYFVERTQSGLVWLSQNLWKNKVWNSGY